MPEQSRAYRNRKKNKRCTPHEPFNKHHLQEQKTLQPEHIRASPKIQVVQTSRGVKPLVIKKRYFPNRNQRRKRRPNFLRVDCAMYSMKYQQQPANKRLLTKNTSISVLFLRPTVTYIVDTPTPLKKIGSCGRDWLNIKTDQ